MSKEYYQANKSTLLAQANEYYEKNRQKILEYKKQYYQKKRQEKIEYARKQRIQNPDYWKTRDPIKHAIGSKKWRLAHPVECRFHKQQRRAKTKGVKIDKTKIHNWDSMICGLCQTPIINEYHIDHIIPLSKGGPHNVDNLQLAHPVCNMSKGARLLDAVSK